MFKVERVLFWRDVIFKLKRYKTKKNSFGNYTLYNKNKLDNRLIIDIIVFLSIFRAIMKQKKVIKM